MKFLAKQFSRRGFLAGLGASVALPLLAACEAQVVEVEKVQVVEKEVPVERVVTQVVEKEVEKVVTVQIDRPVEVEKVVTVEVEKAVEVEVEKVVTVQVEVERPVEVEKVVEVERVVEVEVEVEKEVQVEVEVEKAPVLPKDRDQIIMRSLALRAEGRPVAGPGRRVERHSIEELREVNHGRTVRRLDPVAGYALRVGKSPRPVLHVCIGSLC